MASNKIISTNTTLSADVSGTVVFNASNITLNCNYHEVKYSSSFSYDCGGSRHCGIYSNGKSGITIKNCKVHGFNMTSAAGIVISGGHNATVDANSSYSNYKGIIIENHDSASLSSEIYDNADEGISLRSVSNSAIFGLDTLNNKDGIDEGSGSTTGGNHNEFSYLFTELNALNGIEIEYSVFGVYDTIGSYSNGQNGFSFDSTNGTSAGGAFSGGHMLNCESSDNAKTGIRTQDYSYFWFEDNTSDQNGSDKDAYSETKGAGVYFFDNAYTICCSPATFPTLGCDNDIPGSQCNNY
jgi:hypothetical protein